MILTGALVAVPLNLLLARIEFDWSDGGLRWRFLSAMISVLEVSVIGAGVALFVAGLYEQRQVPSLGSVFGRLASRLIPLTVGTVLATMLIGIGSIFLLIPGLIFTAWFSLVPQVVAVEGRGGGEALGRSHDLVRRRDLVVYLFLLVTAALNLAAEYYLGAPLLTELEFMTAWITYSAFDIVTIPPLAVATAALYVNLIALERGQPPPRFSGRHE